MTRLETTPDPPGSPARQSSAPMRWTARSGLHLLLAVAAVLLVFFSGRVLAGDSGYRVIGHPTTSFLAEGAQLETGVDASLVRIEIADIGSVELGGDARVRATEVSSGAHRLYLERGHMRAAISAESGVFGVRTPAGLSVGRSCEYDLDVAPDGSTRVEVAAGTVTFEGAGRFAVLPRGARCRATEEDGPASPVREDPSDALLDAIAWLDFAERPAAARMTELLGRLDSLTLWHLLQARSSRVRDAACTRLAGIVPPPVGIDLAACRAGDRVACDAWLPEMSWFSGLSGWSD